MSWYMNIISLPFIKPEVRKWKGPLTHTFAAFQYIFYLEKQQILEKFMNVFQLSVSFDY